MLSLVELINFLLLLGNFFFLHFLYFLSLSVSEITQGKDVNDTFDNISKLLLSAKQNANTGIKIKYPKVKTTWANLKVVHCINQKKLAHLNLKKFPTAENKSIFREKSREVKKVVLAAKTKFYSGELDKAGTDSKKYWDINNREKKGLKLTLINEFICFSLYIVYFNRILQLI